MKHIRLLCMGLALLLGFALNMPLAASAQELSPAQKNEKPAAKIDSYHFQNMDWDIDATIAKGILDKKYKFLETQGDDMLFEGLVFGWRSEILAVNAYDKLVRIVIATTPRPLETLYQTYKRTVRNITAQYGAPQKDMRAFWPPYHEGDGREMEAIHKEKAILIAQWPRAKDNSTLYVRLDREGAVMITYEGPNGQNEEKQYFSDSKPK